MRYRYEVVTIGSPKVYRFDSLRAARLMQWRLERDHGPHMAVIQQVAALEPESERLPLAW